MSAVPPIEEATSSVAAQEATPGQLETFWAAVRFFTRVPVPGWVGHSQAQLDRAARWFPLVGALVGLVGGGVTLLAWAFTSPEVAVLLGMAATVLITGAFHEDGLGDACDGFGGGWTPTQILIIMKDSRIGSYGTVGVFFALLIKWQSLVAVGWARVLPALMAGHAVSRLTSTVLIFALEYVREDLQSKAKPLARRMRVDDLVTAVVLGLLPCGLLPMRAAVTGVVTAGLVAVYLARRTVKRLGGYTGDVLGAVQQITEAAFYLALTASL